MTEETNRPDSTEQPSSTRDQIFAALLLIFFIAAVVIPLGYFLIKVVIPGIAAGFAQFSGMSSNMDYSGPMFR